jgi:hypothetical protein
MDPKHHALSMEFNTPLRQRAGRFLLKVGGWIRINFAQQRRNSGLWKKQESYGGQTLGGALLSTWFQNLTVHSGPVAITAALIPLQRMTVTPSLQSRISQPILPAALFFQK